MCIRDRGYTAGDNVLYLWDAATGQTRLLNGWPLAERAPGEAVPLTSCLLYTSDAADERSSVDLGGRRIIKKKKNSNEVRSRRHKKTKEKK